MVLNHGFLDKKDILINHIQWNGERRQCLSQDGVTTDLTENYLANEMGLKMSDNEEWLKYFTTGPYLLTFGTPSIPVTVIEHKRKQECIPIRCVPPAHWPYLVVFAMHPPAMHAPPPTPPTTHPPAMHAPLTCPPATHAPLPRTPPPRGQNDTHVKNNLCKLRLRGGNKWLTEMLTLVLLVIYEKTWDSINTGTDLFDV